jgi:predicted NBD/HSP70 family sugar kinase
MEFMNEQIVQRVENFAVKYSESDLEVGISVPGIADQTSGKVKFVPYFGWREWDIAELVKEKTGLDAAVENDANAIALAELWFGRDVRKTTNFITVLVAEGIGTGIIFDGQIYRGENGAAGEFGHMIVGGGKAPVKCSCGSEDCWEAQASEKAILARYQCYLMENKMTSESLTFRELLNLAINGEELAQKVFRETAKYLGIGISNLIIGMSPRKIIVSGTITKAWNLISDELEFISERSVLGGLPKTMIIPSTLGDSPTLIGSLSLVLAKKFASAG